MLAIRQKRVSLINFVLFKDVNLESITKTTFVKYIELSQNIKEPWILDELTITPIVLQKTCNHDHLRYIRE